MTEPPTTPAPEPTPAAPEAPAPPVDLMEELGLRLRVSFPEFLALPDGPQAERKRASEQQ
jgi:hypothetical protein